VLVGVRGLDAHGLGVGLNDAALQICFLGEGGLGQYLVPALSQVFCARLLTLRGFDDLIGSTRICIVHGRLRPVDLQMIDRPLLLGAVDLLYVYRLSRILCLHALHSLLLRSLCLREEIVHCLTRRVGVGFVRVYL